jgi:magnesium transporter
MLIPMPFTRLYRNGSVEAQDFPIADVSDHLRDETAVIWFDLCGPEPAELQQVSEELGLHELAVEDALTSEQRPKLVRYHNHLFLSAYVVGLDEQTGSLSTNQVAAFVTRQALVTVRQSAEVDIDEVIRRWDASPDLAEHGVAFLVHGLIDYVVDSHFAAVQSLDEQLEGLEDQVFDPRPREREIQRRTFELRKSLVTLRRVVLPMREVVNSLLRRDLHVLDDAMVPYYQDVYDHVLRASEWTESLRDLVTTMLETQLTVRSNHLNVIMKQVTSWAAIIAVPTAITGFYGMNVPYPGFERIDGFWASLLMMVALSGGLYLVFRRKGWL